MSRSRPLRIVVPSLLAAILAACSSVPPPPADHFYRLEPTPVPVVRPALGALRLQPLRADSLYAERPVIFSESADARQLRQYHYHLWLYPPAQMVEDHLRASLATLLDFSGGEGAPKVEGRVLRFERVIEAKASRAVVELELRLVTAGKTGVARTYRVDQQAADGSLTAFVTAMEQALGNIYGQWVTDLAVESRP